MNGNVTVTSDINMKEDTAQLVNADSLLSLLNPVTFKYKQTGNAAHLHLPTTEQMGLIAQEVEPIFPNIVKQATHPAEFDSLGNVTQPSFTYKTMDYDKLIPVLIAGHNELSEKVKAKDSLIEQMNEDKVNQDSINNSLQDQINTLQNMITSCCNNSNSQNTMQQNNNGNGNNNSMDITLTDNIPSIVLDQNVPNPFAEQTTITYKLTEGVQKAQMLFYNIEGKLIQSVQLAIAAGQGQINVFANDLSTGVYTYTLVVDGEIKGTKRMVKE